MTYLVVSGRSIADPASLPGVINVKPTIGGLGWLVHATIPADALAEQVLRRTSGHVVVVAIEGDFACR